MSNLRFQVAAGAGASAFVDKGASANRFAKLFDPDLALHYKFATTQSLKDLRGGPTLSVVRTGTATQVNAQGLIEDVAANIGRFDFDPATGESLGLLVEEARTNIALQSGDMVSAPWVSLLTPLITANSAISPRGLLEATLINDNNTTNAEGVQQSITVPDNSSVHTVSVFVKKDSGISNRTTGIDIEYTGGTEPTPVKLRLNTETGETNGAGSFGTQAEDFGDWWRIRARAANNGLGNTTLLVTVLPATSSIGTFIDAGATIGTAHVWGMQVELGTTPTSYIETAAGAVTRNSDLISTADVSWLNVLVGTMFTETRVAEILESGVGTPNILRLDDSSESNRIVFSYDREPGIFRSFVFLTALGGTAHNINETNLALVAGNTLRLAMAWGGTTFITSANNLAVRTKTGITVPTGIDTLRFSSLAGTAQNNGHLREMRYYTVKKSAEFIKTLSAGLIPA